VIEEKITDLLEDLFKTEEFSDCFLVEVKLHANQKLEVFMDGDNGITFARCQRTSRYLEKYIDEEGWLGEKYILEVSSPGIGRPLKLRRQFPKNVGRKVEVTLTEGTVKSGTLVEVNDTVLVIEEKVVLKEGKKKKRTIVKTSIAFDAIKQTVVKASF
jgi:ribosome maturation factor RimP